MLVESLDNPIVTTSVPSPEDVQFSDPEEIARRPLTLLELRGFREEELYEE